jgi:hypothetical protein
MFQLSAEELKNLMFQFGTSRWGGTTKNHYAYTEQGFAMLSGVLTCDVEISFNSQIMRIFTRVGQIFMDTFNLRRNIEKIKKKLENQDTDMEIVFQYLNELIDKRISNNPELK